jgi:hypothetical protein
MKAINSRTWRTVEVTEWLVAKKSCHCLLLILKQLGARNTDELYGDAAGLRSLVRLVEGFAV